MKQKVEELQELATDLISDGQEPELYFVTDEGVVVTVTRDFDLAYEEWRALSLDIIKESALEARSYGVVCAVEPEYDSPDARLFRLDDSGGYLEWRKSR